MYDIRSYMSLLTLYENNFRILHWKLSGVDFHTAHERFGDYYTKLGEMMDETAEQMLTIGQNPPSFKESMEILEGSEINAHLIPTNLDIASHTANGWAAQMFQQLLDISNDLAKSSELPEEVADVFMDHARWFRIEGVYKLGRANLAPTEEPNQ